MAMGNKCFINTEKPDKKTADAGIEPGTFLYKWWHLPLHHRSSCDRHPFLVLLFYIE